ncbi:hypothetical protein POJ06DRAFT_68198 [Lipomyces tetrasporus]|uniref:Uncharacterized protein n=1 Tax=Lipomyces tetrasporus TaxID=54092 RepID=A0AAD7VUB3_9ASCO|nr:uncharacterized protein POJ06DRAFT_68198 [Lipomyces tetrasporus]KAJ8101634.1 hypothetical protein POJ06DRAFT_68198 [Lipomyces tetrasporus]
MAYVVDRVLEPPSQPLTTPWDKLQDISEEEYIRDLFSEPLSAGWGIVYRQDMDLSHFQYFLCMNWAAHRLRNDLRPGQRFPEEAIWPTTDESVEQMTDTLQTNFNLVPCKATDPEKICITWGDNGNQHSIAHIQVLYNGRWESKMSDALWAITHGEDDYANLSGWNLKKTAAFRRA